jgi:hypothetical protein
MQWRQFDGWMDRHFDWVFPAVYVLQTLNVGISVGTYIQGQATSGDYGRMILGAWLMIVLGIWNRTQGPER